MKKILLTLMALTVSVGLAFAQTSDEPAKEDFGPFGKADVSGSATLTWGIDFGSGTSATPTHGFENKASLEIWFPLFKKKTLSSTGDGDVFAEIKLNQFFVELWGNPADPGNAGVTGAPSVGTGNKGISAKIVFFGAYVTVYNKPSFAVNFADSWPRIDAKSWTRRYFFKPGFTGFGTKIGYANKDLMGLDVGLKIGSNGSWKDTKNSQYGMGLDFSLAPLDKMLTIDLGVNATFATGTKYGDTNTKVDLTKNLVNFGVGLSSEPIDSLKIKLGFDGAYAYKLEKNKFAYEIGFSTAYKWVSFGFLYGTPSVLPGSVNSSLGPIDDIAMRLRFSTAASGPTNFVEGLAAGFEIQVEKLLDNSWKTTAAKNLGMTVPLDLKVWASYKAKISDSMWIKPYFNLWGKTNKSGVGTGVTPLTGKKTNYFGIAYNIGVAFSPMERVEVFADWMHGAKGCTTVANHKVHNGTFKLGVTVKW